jgi:peptide deformylase
VPLHPGVPLGLPPPPARRCQRVDMHGDPVRVEGSEMLARAIQHETDHLDGVLFIDRLDAEARAAATAALEEAEWAGVPAYLPVPAPVVKVSPH